MIMSPVKNKLVLKFIVLMYSNLRIHLVPIVNLLFDKHSLNTEYFDKKQPQIILKYNKTISNVKELIYYVSVPSPISSFIVQGHFLSRSMLSSQFIIFEDGAPNVIHYHALLLSFLIYQTNTPNKFTVRVHKSHQRLNLHDIRMFRFY